MHADRRPADGPVTAPAVVTNLSTSRIVDDVARGGRPVRARAGRRGERGRAMRDEGALIGGEGNGGVIFPELHLGRDAPLAAALILQHSCDEGRTLSQIVAGCPALRQSSRTRRPRGPGLDAVYDALRRRFPDAKVDEQDGLRLAWPDRWVHVRPSGTEPIVRVIAEAPTAADADALVAAARELEHLRGFTPACAELSDTSAPAWRPHLLIEGLKRLEYRGYDSAGVAMMNGTGVETRKAAGKISRARAASSTATCRAALSASRTRAGRRTARPTTINAHPHTDQRARSRSCTTASSRTPRRFGRRSSQRGHTFRSETDTEVLAHLIEESIDGNLEEAVASALRRSKAPTASPSSPRDEPERLVAARKGARCSSGSARTSTSSQRRVGAPRSTPARSSTSTTARWRCSPATATGSSTWTPRAISKTVNQIDWDLARSSAAASSTSCSRRSSSSRRRIENTHARPPAATTRARRSSAAST